MQQPNVANTRWSWNVLPYDKADAKSLVVPIGCLHTPLKKPVGGKVKVPLLKYLPLTCNTCQGVLNNCCRLDFSSKMWSCPFCQAKNVFPNSYSGISEKNLPAELFKTFSTVEYVVSPPNSNPQHPIFLYVVDTCMKAEELNTLKEQLLMSLDIIPENAIVGLITFGTTVQLYELGFDKCSKAYVFRGDIAPSLQQVQSQLGINFGGSDKQTSINPNQVQNGRKRFLPSLSESEVLFTSIIEELQVDPWPTKNKSRERRCTGIALTVATLLLESLYKHHGGSILTFIGGPCTLGNGLVVGMKNTELLRSHNDITAGKAKYLKDATKFYDGLAKSLVSNGHSVDIFSAYLDQTGIREMRSLSTTTGGTIILTDSFTNPVFKKSLVKYFDVDENEHLERGFNGTFEVKTSADLKISGAIGNLSPITTKSIHVSDDQIGYGKTNTWKINSINPDSTIALYFNLTQQVQNVTDPNRYVQFIIKYQHASGDFRMRVTTLPLKFVGKHNTPNVAKGFDQEAAAALVARMAIFKAKTEYVFDILRWIDRSLISLCRKFGTFQQNNPDTLYLPNEFCIFPQLMYHLRRSQFLRVFNSSPDETTFYHLHLNNSTCENCITMIQPNLFSFSYNNAKQSVLLDSRNVKKDVVLMLDTFFQVLIHTGERIAYWRDEKYNEQDQYAWINTVLENPKKEAVKVVENRFPYPVYIECDEDTSQARYLLTRVNPHTTHNTPNQYGQQSTSTRVLTDDASLEFFSEHLKKLVVSG